MELAMAVRVYIWEHDRTSSWGHVSLEVMGTSTYISWWPDFSEKPKHHVGKNNVFAKLFVGTTNLYKVKHTTNTSLQQDVNDEKKKPQYVAEFKDKVLNEKAIQLWWSGYAVQNASFDSLKKNCSTTVIRALRAGGSDDLLGINLVKKKSSTPSTSIRGGSRPRSMITSRGCTRSWEKTR
jgi:hypothetical protein